MLSYVEAIPMDVLEAGVPWTWETFPEYMGAIGQRLGVNVGTLVGHSAVRLYAMGEQCSDRPATDAELEAMRRMLREAIDAGALGLSITRNMNHFDVEGKRIPAACAPESELFALADVLREAGTGVIQCGGGTNPEMKDGLLSRISQASGRPIMYNTLLEQARQPGRWKKHLEHVEATARQGIRAIPLCNPGSVVNRFTMQNCQVFRGMPTWLPIFQASDDEKLSAYRNPDDAREAARGGRRAARAGLDVLQALGPDGCRGAGARRRTAASGAGTSRRSRRSRASTRSMRSSTWRWRRALETVFSLGEINMDTEAVAQILGSPYAVVGLSDGGAHVQFHSNVSNPTRLLGYWVREKGIMSLERPCGGSPSTPPRRSASTIAG